MHSIQAIEQAIQELPAHELAELRQWFAKFDETVWDAQIEADANAGKLDALAAEALTEYQNGAVREL
jgi:hypothetical protein